MKKFCFVLASFLAIASAVSAQSPGAPPGPPPELVLREVLGLNDAQLAALRDLVQARAAAAGAIEQQVEQRRQVLSTALSAASPDPATVGAIVVSIASLQKQFGQAQEGFRNGFLALLNDEQKSRVGFIQGVETALKAAGALHQIGL